MISETAVVEEWWMEEIAIKGAAKMLLGDGTAHALPFYDASAPTREGQPKLYQKYTYPSQKP
jgi:hypothetical protein